MDERVIKYLHDMLNAISEIEMASERFGKQYEVFENDVIYRKFVERNIEILGEAMNRILKIEPDFSITSARKIVDTRNYVIHAYDSLKPDIVWSIVINHIPRLKSEVINLIEEAEKD